MIRSRTLAGFAALALVLVAPGCGKRTGDGDTTATDAKAPPSAEPVLEMEMREPWIRPTPAGTTMGALYFTVASPDSDQLVSVSVPATVAAKTELHATTKDGDEVSMHPVAAIDLPAQQAVELAPGSYHVMLVGLAKPLVAGDSVDVTLHFRKAAELGARVPVREPF